MKRAIAALALLALAGCVRKVPLAPPPNAVHDYIDLLAGMRLRIIAPVTKSGKLEVQTQSTAASDGVITLKADDLEGYETAFWSITGRFGGGVAVHLAAATFTVNGHPAPLAQPAVALVHVPPAARFIRAFYFTRKSGADHNMALAGAGRLDQLDAFTRVFRESPETACDTFVSQHHYCEWIPAGVAVRPESQQLENGAMQWPRQ